MHSLLQLQLDLRYNHHLIASVNLVHKSLSIIFFSAIFTLDTSPLGLYDICLDMVIIVVYITLFFWNVRHHRKYPMLAANVLLLPFMVWKWLVPTDHGSAELVSMEPNL
jgi:hypothetical protein